jgi:hypothetical protein
MNKFECKPGSSGGLDPNQATTSNNVQVGEQLGNIRGGGAEEEAPRITPIPSPSPRNPLPPQRHQEGGNQELIPHQERGDTTQGELKGIMPQNPPLMMDLTQEVSQPQKLCGPLHAPGPATGGDQSGPGVDVHECVKTANKGEHQTSVTLGQHRIQVNGVTEKLLIYMDDITLTAPNFVRMYSHTMFYADAEIIDFEHAITMRSFICRSPASGRFRKPIEINGRVLPYRIGRIHHQHRQTLQVLGCARIQNGSIEKAARFPNERSITSALQPALNILNPNMFRNTTGLIDCNWEFFDNSMLYAKMTYFAEVLECYQYINVVPVINPFAVGPDPIWFDLDAAQPDPEIIRQAVYERKIVLIQNQDFNLTDLQLVYWLAKGGVRIDGPDGASAHVFENGYVEWPSIPILILGRGPAPGAPDPQLRSGAAVLQFTARLASNRSEWRWFTKGLYIARDLVGLRYNEFHHHFYPIKSDLSPSSVHIPDPADYNFLFRVIGIYPANDVEEQAEPRVWMAQQPAVRTRLSVLYTTIVASCATTVLYDINFSTDLLIAWGLGLEVDGLATQLLMSPLNMPPLAPLFEVAMFGAIKRGFPILLGCSVMGNLYPNQSWIGISGSLLNANGSYAPYHAHCPPQLFPILCGDQWYKIRFIEWGISGPSPKANLSDAIEMFGAQNRRGWYASKGDILYDQTAISKTPVTIIPYGIQALNIILQYLDHAESPLLSRMAHPWLVGGHSAWYAPVPIPGAQVIWDPHLHIITPCTLMTFSYPNCEVYAPCYIFPNIPDGELRALLCLRGQPLDTVGFPLDPPKLAFTSTLEEILFPHFKS